MGNVISDLASGAAGGLLGGIGKLAKDIRTAITGIDPEKAAELTKQLAELESTAMLAQTKINEIEAASPSLFVSGWRPAMGWTCVLAFVYNYIIGPMGELVMELLHTGVAMPVLDMATMLPVLLGMLGLGTMRSFEKYNEVARTK